MAVFIWLMMIVAAVHATVDPRDPRVDDRIVINQLLVRYAHSVDHRDWKGFRSVFTHDAHIDYSQSFMGSKGNVDEIVAFLQGSLNMFGLSVHGVSNVDITFTGPSTAKVTAYLDNPMYFMGSHAFSTTPALYIRGYYHHEVVKTQDGAWKSKKLWEEIISVPVPLQLLMNALSLAIHCATIFLMVKWWRGELSVMSASTKAEGGKKKN